MPASSEYREFVMDLVAPLGHVTLRSMFGGSGLFYGAIMFGLIADDRLYFKVDGGNRPDFVAAGCQPFTYQRRKTGGRASMSYYEVPADLFDEPESFLEWAREAVDAALRVSRAKHKKTK